jgi:hypothetical protein
MWVVFAYVFFLIFVALLMAFLAVPVLAKRFAIGAVFISAGVFAMAGCAVAGGRFIDPDAPVSLRFVTLDETPPVVMQDAPLGLTGAGYQVRSLAILSHRNDLVELRQHIKYELRRGNITAEKAITLNHLIDEIDLEASVDVAVGEVAVQRQALADLTHSQAQLNETLADTIKLVKVLGSVHSPEFAGAFIAAKIQVVRLLVEKAAVDGSIDEIRQTLKRSNAG